MSDLQRDIALVQATIAWGAESAAPFEAWQRIRARLTPDRERVARAMLRANSQNRIGGDGDWPKWEVLTPPQQAHFLHIADAAIKAMEGEE